MIWCQPRALAPAKCRHRSALTLYSHPADKFDVLKTNWRQNGRRLRRFKTCRENPINQRVRQRTALTVTSLKPFPQQHLFAARPRRFQDIHCQRLALVRRFEGRVVANGFSDTVVEWAHRWLQIGGVRFPHPSVSNVVLRSIPETMDPLPQVLGIRSERLKVVFEQPQT